MAEAVKGAGEAIVGVAVAPVWTVTVICEISGIPPAAFTGMQAGKMASSPARTNVNIFFISNVGCFTWLPPEVKRKILDGYPVDCKPGELTPGLLLLNSISG